MLTAVSLLFLLAQRQATTPGELGRDVVLEATRAVERDSAAASDKRWRTRLQRNSADRAALLGLASLARLTYAYEAAESLYARIDAAGEGANSASGIDDVAVHTALGRAHLALARGDLSAALPLFQRARVRARSAMNAEAEGESVLRVAGLVARARGVAAADSLLPRAESLLAGRGPAARAMLHCARAGLRPAAAEQDLAVGARLAREAGELRLEANCRFQSFVAATRRGSSTPATLAIPVEVAALQRRARDRSGLALTLQWAGWYMSTLGQYGYAWATLQEAVREGEASRNDAARSWALHGLANVAQAAGDLDGAHAHATAARALFAARGDSVGLLTAVALQGDLALAAGNAAAATAAYREALEWNRRRGSDPMNLHVALALASMAAGDARAARQELEAARRIAQSQNTAGWERGLAARFADLALLEGNLDEAERLLRESTERQSYLRRYVARARLAEVYLRRGDALAAEQELAQASDELDAWRAHLAPAELRTAAFQFAEFGRDPDLAVATVLAASVRAGRVEQAFALAERRRARELLDRVVRAEAFRGNTVRAATAPRGAGSPTVDASALRAALPDERTALLLFVTGRGGEPTLLFVATRRSLSAHILEPVDSLQDDVARFVALVESGAAASAPARALGAALLDAAVATLPQGVSNLVVVADDVLHRVPFDALVLASGESVIDRFTLSLAPSASVAVRLWSLPRVTAKPARVLVLADPSPPSAPTHLVAAFARSGGLQPLPGARREASAIARLARAADVYTGRDATASRLMNTDLSAYGVVHLATHAVADERSITSTALALGSANDDGGFVLPGDLAALNLRAALVVLSACRTAGGLVVRGEGVQGLTAPLLEGGARTVVATLWQIDDRATTRLMDSFYRALAAGHPVADALRTAKLDAKRRGVSVAAWAAFVATGDASAAVPIR